MSLWQRFVAGIQLANKSLSFQIKNLRLILYTFLPFSMLIAAAVSYLLPIIQMLRSANDTDPQQLILLFMSKPEIFVPSLLTKILFGLALMATTCALFAIIHHTANSINNRTTSIKSIFSLITSNLVNIILWSAVSLGLLYAISLRLAQNYDLISFLSGVTTLFLLFTFPYVVLKKEFIVNGAISSIKLAWRNLATLIGTTLWVPALTLLVLAVFAAPVALTYWTCSYFSFPLWLPLAMGLIAGITYILFVVTMMNITTTITFLWAHNELPAPYAIKNANV